MSSDERFQRLQAFQKEVRAVSRSRPTGSTGAPDIVGTPSPMLEASTRPEVQPSCPSCGRVGPAILYELESVPIESCRLVNTQAEARDFPREPLRLGCCSGCGLIWNVAFDPRLSDPTSSYEETQGFSSRYREFAEDLAARLVEKHRLYGKRILEIGCGKGEFILLMSELGGNVGVGIDPGLVDRDIEDKGSSRVAFIKDFYSEDYAHLGAELVVCRHTLEHIPRVGGFLRLLRRSLAGRPDTLVVLEVPDVGRIMREVAFWDFYYEHCSYFSCGSLARALREAGFEVLDLSLEFDGQYIVVECRPSGASPSRRLPLEESPAELARAVRDFRGRVAERRHQWRERLGHVRAERRRVVLWGSGSKGAAFATALGPEFEVPYITNINPVQHYRYVVGTGQRIVPPEFLLDYRPHLVVSLNRVYVEEITSMLQAMGVEADVVAVQ